MENIINSLHFTSRTWAFILPFILIFIDFLTGMIDSFLKKNFKSSKMRSGLSKKIGEIVIIVIGAVFSKALDLPEFIIDGIFFYISFMEFMSILENIDKMGVHLPDGIKKYINNDILEEETKDFIEGRKRNS